MTRTIPLVFAILLISTIFAITSNVSASPALQNPTPRPTPTRRIATAAELQKAKIEWSSTAHAETFDEGQGANTTCARCKSPMNWDPQAPSQTQALDCAACKRVPGAPRPDLEGGIPIALSDWKQIGCEICHEPVGNSYYTSISYWNQVTGKYEPVTSVTALCTHCHEGTHGFEVIEEQHESPAHNGWECTQCHGAHGTPSNCTNCHDPTVGVGAEEHEYHTQVNCTACHDAGGLVIWHDTDAGSRHYDEFVPVRFAHALRSWTSHDIQKEVWCGRCHHLRQDNSMPVASQVTCEVCHPEGYSMFWCQFFPRDLSPFPTPTRNP